MNARFIFKTIALSGVLLSIFGMAANGKADPFTFVCAGLIFVLSAGLLWFAEEVL